MDERLAKACIGKSASQGGLNVDDLMRIAVSRGLLMAGTTATRAKLIELLCIGTAPPPVAAVAAAAAAAARSPPRAAAAAAAARSPPRAADRLVGEAEAAITDAEDMYIAAPPSSLTRGVSLRIIDILTYYTPGIAHAGTKDHNRLPLLFKALNQLVENFGSDAVSDEFVRQNSRALIYALTNGLSGRDENTASKRLEFLTTTILGRTRNGSYVTSIDEIIPEDKRVAMTTLIRSILAKLQANALRRGWLRE